MVNGLPPAGVMVTPPCRTYRCVCPGIRKGWDCTPGRNRSIRVVFPAPGSTSSNFESNPGCQPAPGYRSCKPVQGTRDGTTTAFGIWNRYNQPGISGGPTGPRTLVMAIKGQFFGDQVRNLRVSRE